MGTFKILCRNTVQGWDTGVDRARLRQSLLPQEFGAHEARVCIEYQKLVPRPLSSEFLHQTGASVDFNYDVESAYLKCSFFEEDVDVMVNLLLDLALREKKLFHVR